MYQLYINFIGIFFSLCFDGPSSDEPCRQQLSKAKLRSARPWKQTRRNSLFFEFMIFFGICLHFLVQIVNFRILLWKQKHQTLLHCIHPPFVCEVWLVEQHWLPSGKTTVRPGRSSEVFRLREGFVQAAESRCLDSLVCFDPTLGITMKWHTLSQCFVHCLAFTHTGKNRQCWIIR